MDEQLLTLSQLLGDARRPAAGAAAFGRTSHASTSALPSLASPGPPRLHPGLARELRELSALDSAFTRWQAEAEAFQRAAARDFADDQAFSLALVVLNRRGERRRGARVAQEWYYTPRVCAASAGALPCARCRLHIARRQAYFVDRAAPSWAQADEVCRRCMLCCMRALLGDDDAGIQREAQAILEAGWQPRLDAALAQALGGGRRSLLDLQGA